MPIDELLREERWLSHLACRLVGVGNADDVVQDTWLAALQRPPRHAGAARSWLSRVVNNFAIGQHREQRRRQRSESAAARRESVPSTEATVERLATYEFLVGLVKQLAEPYRTAVLLRHYHDLEIAEVARRMGITASNARQRVKRGLDQLRQQLRERYGSDWRGSMCLILWPSGTIKPAATLLATSGALMMSKQMLAAAAAVLVVGVVAISIWASDPGTPSLDPSERGTGEQRGEEKAPDTMKSTAEAGMERTELVSSARKPASGVHYAGKILDTRGQPLAGVRLLPAKAPSATPYAESDRMGLFSFTHKKLEETPQVDERFTIVRGRPLNQETTQPDAMLYIVAPNVSVTGQVFNEESVALAGVTVEVQLLPLLDFPAPLDDTDGPGFSGGETNEIGRFDIAGLPGGAARLRLSKDGFENAYCEIPTSNKLGVPIVLKREKGNRSSLAGRVFDHRGMPVPKATVGLGKRTTKTDAFGAYRLTFDRNGKDYAGGKSPLYAGKPGLQTRLIRDFSLPEARHARQDLHLAGPTLSIEGVVRDAEGELAADVLVVLWKEEQIANTTFAENLALDDSIKPLPGFGYAKVYARTKSDGAFVLRGLSARTYVLRVLHKQHLSFSTEPIQAGTRGLELRYPADNFRKLTGRVVNRDGEPMPKIRVGMSVCVYKTSGGNSWKRGEETVTNAKGEFTLHKVLRHEQTLLSFMGDSIITGFEAIGKGFTDGFKPEQGRADNPDVVEIVVDRRCHFRIETDDPALARARFQLLDANGKNMQISAFSAGGGSTNNETMSLRRGKTPVLATSERTVTLLLVKEKRRIPMSLTPGKVAVVRL